MLHDLILMNEDDELLAIAKIDITNDETNLMGKMVNVNHFSMTPIEEDDENKDEKLLSQKKINDYLLRKQYPFKEVIEILQSIEIKAKFNGEVVPTTTTTTTTAATTTTTTSSTTTTTTQA